MEEMARGGLVAHRVFLLDPAACSQTSESSKLIAMNLGLDHPISDEGLGTRQSFLARIAQETRRGRAELLMPFASFQRSGGAKRADD